MDDVPMQVLKSKSLFVFFLLANLVFGQALAADSTPGLLGMEDWLEESLSEYKSDEAGSDDVSFLSGCALVSTTWTVLAHRGDLTAFCAPFAAPGVAFDAGYSPRSPPAFTSLLML